MAANDRVDMSLDDIIIRDGIRVGGRGRGRGGRRGSALQQRSKPQQFRQRSGGQGFGGRGRGGSRGGGGRRFSNPADQYMRRMNALSCGLMISNLAYSVTDEDLFELFASFGPLKKSTVHYDQFGQSLGTAELVFEMRFDAIKAMNQYNGVPLDGRPMRIRVIGDKPATEDQTNGTSDRGRRDSGRGRNFSFRGQFRGKRQPDVTQEQLDKELDNWRMETE